MNKIIDYFTILTFVLLISCKKEGSVQYTISGKITDADDGNALSAVTVEVEKQVVQNGIYGNTYQTAVSTITDSNGNYSGSWSRENFAALRILTAKSNYIPVERNLNVEQFSDGPVTKDIVMYKEAFASLRFIHANGNASDRLSFTFLNAAFDCNCCSNGWRTWQAATIDTTIACRVYANRWIKYQVQTLIGFTDSSFVDSIYCDAFVTTSRDIEY